MRLCKIYRAYFLYLLVDESETQDNCTWDGSQQQDNVCARGYELADTKN